MKAEVIGFVVAGFVGVATLIDSKLNSEPKCDIITTKDQDSILIDSVKAELLELKAKNDSTINSIKVNNLKLKVKNKHLSKDLQEKLNTIEKLRNFGDEEFSVQLKPKENEKTY